jgi:hypothetical protein
MKSVMLVSIICAAAASVGLAANQRQLDYQERPYAFEGVKPRPVSGFDIELLSATVEHAGKAAVIGDRLQLRFFLERKRPVYLVVREIDQRFFYWLDKAKSSWTLGYNTFSWPASSVLRHLPELSITDLGVLVRLDKEDPSALESVAPATFSTTADTNTTAKGYVFVFKVRDDALVRATVFDETKGMPVFATDLGQQRGGRPFPVHWDLVKFPAPAGPYRLVLKGYVLATNDPLSQVVRFLHVAAEK